MQNGGGVKAWIRLGNRSAQPEKPCSGSPSSERAARPFRLARPVAGLRTFFVHRNGLLRIASEANPRLDSGVA